MSTQTKEETKEKGGKLINMKEISDGTKTVFMVDPRKISVMDGFNVREDFGDIKQLKESIRENGVLKPLVVFQRDGQLFLADGERRFRAVMDLINKEGIDVKSIPCMTEERGTNEETRILRLMLHNDGKPLTPIEEAQVVARLTAHGWTPQQIAAKTGRSQAHISNLKLLLSVPQEVINEVKQGNISSTFAVDLARQCGSDTEKLKKTIAKAKEKAKELGKKKVTKKIATEGTTKKTSRKDQKNEWIAILDLAIKALKSNDEKLQFEALQDIQEFRDRFVGKELAEAA